MLAIWANMAAFLSDEVVRTAGWTAKPSGLAFLVIKGHVFFANPSFIWNPFNSQLNMVSMTYNVIN